MTSYELPSGAINALRSLPMASDEAIVLMGHGSRDAEGASEFLTFAARLSARLACPVYPGFLELADPPIVSAIDKAITAGAKSIVAVPWFLLGAGHVKNDVPTAIQWAREHYQVAIRYGSPINVQPEILALLAERLADIDPDHGIGSRETAVLLVQRGSSDPQANADVYRVARLLWEGRKYSTIEVAFSGVVRPNLSEGLERCFKYHPQRILVVPYYLYTGILTQRISTLVAEAAATHPECEFRVAPHFGQDSRLDMLAQRMVEETRHGKATMTCDLCQYRIPLFGREFLVRAPQVSDHSHGLRGTMVSEHTHANDAPHHAHGDGHTHEHHHKSQAADLKDRWHALRECVTAAGITSRQEFTEALTFWHSKSRAQLDAPPPYLLTAQPGHPATAALRWDWDSHRAEEFAGWCMQTLQERFGIRWRVDCEEEDPQLGPHYLRMTLLQYSQTDRRNGENLMSPPTPTDMGDATLTIPNMSSDFALGEQQERCDWRYLNANHWMGAFCTIADRLLSKVGVTALCLETGWFDTVVVFCRSDSAAEIARWFPEAE
ncbi:MAG: sirohydrochlorin chelatase [Chloroflexi bacterium]|nr:MAG: sirohydrochlorin chelatase [Chloroflexota bacterium]